MLIIIRLNVEKLIVALANKPLDWFPVLPAVHSPFPWLATANAG